MGSMTIDEIEELASEICGQRPMVGFILINSLNDNAGKISGNGSRDNPQKTL
jgi:hypothetical protein